MLEKIYLFSTFFIKHIIFSREDFHFAQGNSTKRHEKNGEARKSGAEGATLKLVKEIRENFGSVWCLLSR